MLYVRPTAAEKAPDFALKDITGKTIRLQEILGKGYVLIDFWASWCGPCRNEMIAYKAIYPKILANDIFIVSISTYKAHSAWKDAKEKMGITWSNLIDETGNTNIAKKYGVQQLPANFLIDKNGIIIKKDISVVDLVKSFNSD